MKNFRQLHWRIFPFQPDELAISTHGTFFARTIDMNVMLSVNIFIETAKNKGLSVVEVLQNCVIYIGGAQAVMSDKEEKEQPHTCAQVRRAHGFIGKERDKGIVLEGMKLKVVSLSDGLYTEKYLPVHDAYEPNPGMHLMLANMKYPDYPVALGVIRKVESLTYDGSVTEQIKTVRKSAKYKNRNDVLFSGNTWKIE